MPLTDAAVDLIILVHALEHTADPEELMRELSGEPTGRGAAGIPASPSGWAADGYAWPERLRAFAEVRRGGDHAQA